MNYHHVVTIPDLSNHHVLASPALFGHWVVVGWAMVVRWVAALGTSLVWHWLGALEYHCAKHEASTYWLGEVGNCKSDSDNSNIITRLAPTEQWVINGLVNGFTGRGG